MIQFLMHWDWAVLLIIPIGIFILCILSADEDLYFAGFFMGLFIWLIEGGILCAINSDSKNWDKAAPSKIITVNQMKIIEIPDGTVEIWDGITKIYTIKSIEEYKKKDNIKQFETRELELFGPDYSGSKLIFNE